MVGYTTKRPVLLTIISVISWIVVILNLLMAFSPSIKKLGEFYPALYSFIMCFEFIAFVGVWYMKRWGVELFIAGFFLRDILGVFMGDFTTPGFMFLLTIVWSIIAILLLLFFYKRMDMNL